MKAWEGILRKRPTCVERERYKNRKIHVVVERKIRKERQ
jgi:hypothetical protein